MVKTIVMYKEPEDKAAFEKHYMDVHVPLVQKVPGVVKIEVSRGAMGPYYWIAEVYFNSMEEMQAGWGSPEGKTTSKDVANFVADPKANVVMAFAEVVQ